MHPSLHDFRSNCETIIAQTQQPDQIVRELAPKMHELAQNAGKFLETCHCRGHPAHYARNLIFAGENSSVSLFALVWAPGHWTPIHDHGTWGVVGVVEGVLEEQNFMRVDRHPEQDRDDAIELMPGSLMLMPPGAVSTFVPDPDHIHETGVAANHAPTLSLHLYGRFLADYHVYDRESGTRELVRVQCNGT